uniref:Uncharacterized protein n=1 Tax=Setaria viridis TaxID=4556 RepID=A0A4U6U3L9_SETVI|nr:hypothetical protein SEVIR_6G041350v2 [Setaria viridis]
MYNTARYMKYVFNSLAIAWVRILTSNLILSSPSLTPLPSAMASLPGSASLRPRRLPRSPPAAPRWPLHPTSDHAAPCPRSSRSTRCPTAPHPTPDRVSARPSSPALALAPLTGHRAPCPAMAHPAPAAPAAQAEARCYAETELHHPVRRSRDSPHARSCRLHLSDIFLCLLSSLSYWNLVENMSTTR